MIKISLSLLVLGILLYDISEGCGRVPATPPPPPASTPAVPTHTPSSNETSHSEECTPEEKNITRCIAGQGECFVYIIEERKLSCHCVTDYKGVRCEELNIEIIYPTTDGVATAGIAASVAVAVVVAVVVLGVLIVYYKRRRNRRKEHQRAVNAVNGKLLLPENHTQPRRNNMQCKSNGNYLPCEEKKQMIEYRTTSV